jgi:hypothetical protein
MISSDPYSITIRNQFQAMPFSVPATIWDVPPDPTQTPPVTGTPHDISGWHFMFTLKKNLTDTDAQAIYKSDWQVAAGAGTNGQINPTVPAATINTIEAKFMYYWDVRVIIPPSTDPSQLLLGTVYVNPSVGQRLVPGS